MPNGNSMLGGAGAITNNSGLNLTKQGSQESLEVKMSFIDGPSQSNLNNPSSFYANQNSGSHDHSQSLKNLRIGVSLAESASNSSLITGPKKSLCKPNTKLMN